MTNVAFILVRNGRQRQILSGMESAITNDGLNGGREHDALSGCLDLKKT